MSAEETGVGIEIQLKGSEEALKKLSAAAERLDDPTPLFDLIGASMVTSTRQRFEKETDPKGNPWPKSIRVQLEGGKTLFDQGTLANSFSHEASRSGVEWGTNVIYAAIHQLGGDIVAKDGGALHFTIGGADVFVPKVTIPQRAFLGLNDDDEATIAELAAEYIMAPIDGSTANAR